jgi:hypothetical protein
MNKYKSFLILLGIFCAVLVGASFMIAELLCLNRCKFDAIRISNFNDIKFKVEDYYAKNGDIHSPDQLKLTLEQTKPFLKILKQKHLFI